jgi:hypothetical protein
VNLVLGASWCFAVAGIVLGLAALATFGKPLPALRVMLELLTAAGLLRLSVDSTWAAIAAAAALIVLRKTITRSLIADLTTPRGRRAPHTT